MKAKFLIAAATLVVMAAPVFANTPSSDPFNATSNDQTAQAPGRYTSDTYGDTFVSPFGDHPQLNQGDDMRPMERNKTDPAPPRIDASGVPDPRI